MEQYYIHLCVIFILKFVMWIFLILYFNTVACSALSYIMKEMHFYLKNAKYCFSNILPLKKNKYMIFNFQVWISEKMPFQCLCTESQSNLFNGN